jgi:NADPH-dependent 2,4-dienoyl-CoA reductase/sulfur reductase-like enzyme
MIVIVGTGLEALRESGSSASIVMIGAERLLPYDRPGASPRRLPVKGANLEGVLTLRTGSDALRLRAELARGARVVVVVGGLVGLEVAAVARAAGSDVTVVEAARQPLARLLHGEAVAGTIAALHRDHGTSVRTSTTVTELRGRGRVEEVVLSTGERIPAGARVPARAPPSRALRAVRERGAFVMDRPRELPSVRELVARRVRVDERRIVDEGELLALSV